MLAKIRTFINRFSSFTYLNTTQFLGGMNDNIYKLLIIYFFIQMEGIERSHIILATTGAIYVLPFLLFSSTAGTLADRYSKRNIIILTKGLELIIMILGLISFSYSSKLGSYFTLFLLATHSALFSPSKYGILPELLPSERISKANGMMTSFTYLAVILGTFLASFLLDITNRHFIFAASFCVLIAFSGLMTSFLIQYTPPSGSHKKLNVHFISEILKTLKQASEHPSLLAAILGSAFFLFLGAYVQLNMIPFAVQSLNLTDVQGGYLFLLTAIGIGSGSLIAGKISGRRVELALVPLAGIGITACFFALDIYSNSLWISMPLILAIGVFGGIYLVPLDSYIQVSSPKQNIGQAVAATTFSSFVGVLCASALLYVVAEVFDLKADQGFTILGVLTTSLTIAYTILFFDYLTRFVGTILSRIHFKTNYIGADKIPDQPSLYICTHTDWNDTLLMLGAQRQRMRFFIERECDHSKWLKRLYRMLRVVLIPEIEPFENNPACLSAMKSTLARGISVCIFVENNNLHREFEKFCHAHFVQDILKETDCPLLSVHLYKGEKNQQTRFFTRLMNKCRVPATMIFERLDWNSKDKMPTSEKVISRCSNIMLKDLQEEGYQQV